MKSELALAAVVASLAWPGGSPAAITQSEFHAESERIVAESDAARAKCAGYGGNAGEICLAEANGSRRVAMADLNERNSPSRRGGYKLRMARVEAAFEIASEECNARSSTKKEACLAEVKAALARDKADAPGNRRSR